MRHHEAWVKPRGFFFLSDGCFYVAGLSQHSSSIEMRIGVTVKRPQRVAQRIRRRRQQVWMLRIEPEFLLRFIRMTLLLVNPSQRIMRRPIIWE